MTGRLARQKEMNHSSASQREKVEMATQAADSESTISGWNVADVCSRSSSIGATKAWRA